MAKNIFGLLNSDNKIWVYILKTKYGDWNVWNMGHFSHTSWFFKSVCKITEVLKTNFKISARNPLSLDLWKDPCIMDIPINMKPTYINMDIIHENLSFVDLISHDTFDIDALVNIFSSNLDWNWISNINAHSS